MVEQGTIGMDHATADHAPACSKPEMIFKQEQQLQGEREGRVFGSTREQMHLAAHSQSESEQRQDVPQSADGDLPGIGRRGGGPIFACPSRSVAERIADRIR